ncbi:MAG: hypothetical protein QW838_02805 [Candidatus Nitrosotenuis sp.]
MSFTTKRKIDQYKERFGPSLVLPSVRVFSSPRAKSFSPPQQGSLQLWVIADEFTGADGSAVTSWPDKSGKNHTLTARSASGNPTLRYNQINGKKAVQFVQASKQSFYSTASTLVSAFSGDDVRASWFFVLNDQDSTTNNTHYGLFFGTTATFRLKGNNSVSYLLERKDDAGSASNGALGTFGTGWKILTAIFADDLRYSLYVNGVLIGSSAPINVGVLTLTEMVCPGSKQADASSLFLEGFVAEVLMYNMALSGADLDSVHSYLKSSYGL